MFRPLRSEKAHRPSFNDAVHAEPAASVCRREVASDANYRTAT
jgi:hypothetical protein